MTNCQITIHLHVFKRRFEILQLGGVENQEHGTSGLPEAGRVAIIDWTEAHPEILRVYLFGSRARGDNHAGSDIDLGIEIDAPDAGQAYRMWSAFKSDFDEAPDLLLSAQLHIKWYDPGEALGKVGTGIAADGVLLSRRIRSVG